ncbi:hypothetical protein B0T26DRAFT_753208 [Lasiosphaeria miniovina]|uniref:Protein kinase domain-containing protein n=1 Tax=Lasiosphaeria miniovina TaxID=1954250 RepID=A0AA40AC80_9PEZI|nr:uncharacterized protein B0T26DRAFT_753208 [Lasiosphaeria miniovina]KAK0713050.1 hypothetical protein B0T26DRAFT_753208 [Lasiosphaeria miniovina]
MAAAASHLPTSAVGPILSNTVRKLVCSGSVGYLSHHPISASELCLRVRGRLSRNLDDGCECLDKYGMFGATGVLFKLTDPTYGYSFVAKGVQRADASTLTDEAWIYSHCLDLQGIRIPVYLGNIELVYHYPLRSAAAVTHMMLLSWAGTTLCHRPPPAGVDVEAEVDAAVKALHRYGVQHDDIRNANLTWNDETKGSW